MRNVCIKELVQERRNSIANALELCLSWTNLLTCDKILSIIEHLLPESQWIDPLLWLDPLVVPGGGHELVQLLEFTAPHCWNGETAYKHSTGAYATTQHPHMMCAISWGGLPWEDDENPELSWCQLCRHWWHRRTSGATGDDKVGIMKTHGFQWLVLYQHRGLNKMVAIWQTTFSNAFCWMKTFVVWYKFNWNLLVTHHWFRLRLGSKPVPGHYLNPMVTKVSA